MDDCSGLVAVTRLQWQLATAVLRQPHALNAAGQQCVYIRICDEQTTDFLWQPHALNAAGQRCVYIRSLDEQQ